MDQPWNMCEALGSRSKRRDGDALDGLEDPPLPSLSNLVLSELKLSKRPSVPGRDWNPGAASNAELSIKLQQKKDAKYRTYAALLVMLIDRFNYGMDVFVLDVRKVEGLSMVMRRVEQIVGEGWVKWDLATCGPDPWDYYAAYWDSE